MRRFATLPLLLALTLVSAVVPARAQIGAPTHWFAPPAVPLAVLGHPDGSVWVGTTQAVYRYSRTGTLLGEVAPVSCLSLSLAGDGDVVLVAYDLREVRRYTSAGTLVRSWPITDVGANGGRAVVDADDNVYLSYRHNGPNYVLTHIRKYDPVGNVIASIGPLDIAEGITLLNGTLYLSDLYTNTIRTYSTDLQPLGTISVPSQYANDLQRDLGGNLLLTDYYARTLRRLTPDGTVLETVYNGWPGWPGYHAFWNPYGVHQAADGTYFVADSEHGYVLVFDELVTPARTTSFGAVKALYR
jgi:hypothetical protein